MSAQVLLGIDVGTTALKVAVMDAAGGKLLAALARPLRVRTGSDGRREQDPRAIDRSLRVMARRLRRELGQRWRRVAGIGLAAQGGSAILADRQTGRPHTPMQLWNDTRPLHRLPQIAARRPRGYWKRLARLPGPGAGLARIEWHRQHYPDLFRCSGLETIFVGAGEYAFFRLTGTWRQDPGSALQIGCYSVRKRNLVKGPLDSVGVSLRFVAPLRRGHETHRLSGSGSRLLELPAGIPVAGPYIDHEAGYLSATAANGRPLQCSLGTAWVGNFVVDGPPPRGAGSQDLILPSPIGSGSLVLRVMPAGNVTWDWALRELAGRTRHSALKRAETVFLENLLPADGLVAFPWLTRPNACAPHLAGNGRFHGIGATTTRDDMLRAVVAGMCFEFAMPFATVKSTYADAVVLGGGASKGPWFRTILASLFAPLPAYVAGDRAHFNCVLPEDVHARSVRIGLGLRRILDDGGYGALSINFQAFNSADSPTNTMPFLEIAKTMARGIGYAGEGDVLTASLVGALCRAFPAATFTEIFCPDWAGHGLFLSHMGEISPPVLETPMDKPPVTLT